MQSIYTSFVIYKEKCDQLMQSIYISFVTSQIRETVSENIMTTQVNRADIWHSTSTFENVGDALPQRLFWVTSITLNHMLGQINSEVKCVDMCTVTVFSSR